MRKSSTAASQKFTSRICMSLAMLRRMRAQILGPLCLTAKRLRKSFNTFEKSSHGCLSLDGLGCIAMMIWILAAMPKIFCVQLRVIY